MDDNNCQITAVYRYPVKGFSGEKLQQTALQPGETLPGDRCLAVETGTREFDPIEPKYFPKTKFLQLMSHEKLASLECIFDHDARTLALLRDGKRLAGGNIDLPVGRQMIEQFLAAYLGDTLLGTPRIVSADNHHFCDVPGRYVSIINLASLRDLERVIGRRVEPLRFRANVYIDGCPAWSEFDWLDKTLNLDGKPAFEVIDRISRCAATNVDPATASRDMQIPRTLLDVFGHSDCGIYVKVTSSAILKSGMQLSAG